MAETVTILVIDDSEDDRLLYRRELKKSVETTYTIIEADDGEHGLAMIDEAAPTCVLLDYSLPGRNGVEVLKRIRANHPFVPVVMLTGQGNEAVAVTAIQEGAQNYISKSTITPEAIQRAIRVAVEHCAMQKRIHEQRTSLEIFTHALAHDLKEPVRTITSYLALLGGQESLSEKGRGYFNRIRSSAERMEMLVDTVFFYTRLEGAPLEIAEDACDVTEVIEEVKHDIAELIRERGARISVGPMPVVTANRLQLIHIFQNLICNAIQHTSADPEIHVEALDDGGHWTFRVIDNGPGIDESQRQKIFEPFKRLRRTEEKGLGLGLAICKRIIEAHGGTIHCEAAAGVGSVFVFTLPKDATDSASGTDEAMEAAANSNAPAASLGPLANVLLVEDNEADVELARIMLLEEARLQCNFHVANDGREALEMLRDAVDDDRHVDLLLLDINMPGMDGLELLSHLRADAGFKDLPVVICTTSSYDKDMAQAKSLGALGYLSKPADLAKLEPILGTIATLHLERAEDGVLLLRAA